MNRDLLRMLLFIFIMFIGVPANADPREYASWWLKQYGAVKADEDPVIKRAFKVFERVYAAADKKSTRLPDLIVIRSKADPWAVAIKDGSVIITNEAIRTCYRNVSVEKGDSRLAFILGHELAHLAKDDFWHMAAFSAVKTHSSDNLARKALLEDLAKTGDVRQAGASSAQFVRMKELQADSYGVIYMTMAGFDPKAVINSDGTNFFEEWVSQITGKVSYHDESHPGATERAAFLRSQLSSVAADLDYFTIGVRFLQIGRYDEAIAFLEAFREKFPGREVFSNIGLSYLQRALKVLALCDKNEVLRYQLSTVIDTETLGQKLRVRGDGTGEARCREKENYIKDMSRAVETLSKSAGMDPLYIPARLNLSSALIMSAEYSKALAAVEEVLRVNPNDILALNNRAVALYLFGKAAGIGTTDNSLKILDALIKADSANAQALYNRAAILAESGNMDYVTAAWKAFLSVETSGPYAAAVRESLKMPAEGPTSRQNASISPPIPLGEMDEKVFISLQKAQKREFRLGGFSGEIYYLHGSRLVVVGDSIELVEKVADNSPDMTAPASKYGEPLRKVSNINGTTMVYDTFAFDLDERRITKTVYFRKQR